MNKDELEELRHRVEDLEAMVRALMAGVGEVRLSVEVPKVVIERRPVYVKIGEAELPGRIVMLALEGFMDRWRTAGEVASELLRRGWAPKDFKHVRPTLEQLVTLGILERVRPRNRRAKWLYRAAPDLSKRVEVRE